MKTKITGWVLLPRSKKQRALAMKSIYQTIFVDREYMREFRQRWRPGTKAIKATLTMTLS